MCSETESEVGLRQGVKKLGRLTKPGEQGEKKNTGKKVRQASATPNTR